ncbi:LysR family transcriptional regulator [Shigella flexneri]
MIQIKHLKTLQALRTVASRPPRRRRTRPESALSHQFSDLEQRLGFRLFVRKSQPLRFTPPGEVAAAGKPGAAANPQALQACHERQQAALRIAIECHSCIQWLTPALENFRKQWPQVEMDFKSASPSTRSLHYSRASWIWCLPRTSCRAAAWQLADVRFSSAPGTVAGLPLAAKARRTRRRFGGKTIFIYPVRAASGCLSRIFLQPAGVSPQLKSVDNTLLLVQMVAARMGIAALPHWVVELSARV